jgi:guanosine-3',5'-bis(diphosphate) 3'-pyrophosphohydrolase
MDSNYPPEPMDDEGYPLKCKLAGVGGGIIAVLAILFVACMVGSIHTTKMTSMAEVIKAADFAAKKHRDQRREGPDKAPYINHPIGVANILANEGGIDDPIVLQAALLHDTVEDTETSLDEIEQEFGKIVRDLVDEVTDQKDLPSKESKRLQVINAPKKSPRAKLVKLADKLYNLRDLHQSPPE